MDDFAMAVAEAIVEAPVMECLEKRFRTDRSGGPVKKRFRSNAEGIFRLGGIEGLQLWMYARFEQGLGSEEERAELQTIKNCIIHSTRRSRGKWIKEFDAQAEAERQEAELKSQRTQELLAARAREQRAEIDPRAAIKARLENVLELTPPPIPTPVPTPEPKGYSRKAKGECGERIGYKLDCIIREIQGPQPLEDEADWPDDEPLLLDELIAEIRHESSCESTCCAPSETVVDPPVTVTITPGGSDEDMGAPSTAIGGGGFTNDVELSGTAWQMVAGTDGDEHGQVENLEHLQALLETSPEVVGPMLMGALVRLRAALQQIPRDADAMHPVMVPACDAVLLSRSVLRGLR